jgi:hypothetical protein
MTPTDFMPDFRAQAERRRLEAEQRRSQALIDQRSLDNTPEARVRIWERLHQLRMPKDPAHAILQQIAQPPGNFASIAVNIASSRCS